VPPQRRRPDIEETREALRRHDERVEEDSSEEPADAEPEEEKPEPPE
jgi:hypothetical protein